MTNNADKIFGDKVKMLRNRRGWNQGGLANKMDVSQSDISKIESGHVRGGKETIRLLADALEVPFDALVRNTSFASMSDPDPLIENTKDESVPIIAYFASALTGLDEDQERQVRILDEEINQICSEYHRYNVVLYRPRLKTSPKDNPEVSAHEVYEIDRERVAASDIVFLATLYPSLGAGMEIQLALQSCSSIIILKKKTQTFLSRMVSGCPARIEIVEFDNPDELRSKTVEAMNSLLPSIAQFHTGKLLQETSADYDLGNRIHNLRMQRNFSDEMLARTVGVDVAYIQSLETKSERIVNPSLEILRRIARALLVSDAYLISGHQALDDRFQSHSEALKVFARQTEMSVAEFDHLWHEHTEIYKNDLSMIGIQNRTGIGTERYWREMHEKYQKDKARGGKLFA